MVKVLIISIYCTIIYALSMNNALNSIVHTLFCVIDGQEASSSARYIWRPVLQLATSGGQKLIVRISNNIILPQKVES